LFAEFVLTRPCRRARHFAFVGRLVWRSGWPALGLVVAALIANCHAAAAHGIAGNRYFVGTLTFDDPSVADEAIVPLYSAINYQAPGGNVAENRINWTFDRLLTPTLAVTYDSGWIHQNWPIGKARQATKHGGRYHGLGQTAAQIRQARRFTGHVNGSRNCPGTKQERQSKYGFHA